MPPQRFPDRGDTLQFRDAHGALQDAVVVKVLGHSYWVRVAGQPVARIRIDQVIGYWPRMGRQGLGHLRLVGA